MAGRYLGIDYDGGGFNPYTAGAKAYGGGRRSPNSGPADRQGYAERDAKARARRNALLRRLQAEQQGRTMSPDVLRPEYRR